MNQLISSKEMTMGTREIAEMLGKEHSNIKISAERLYSKGVLLTLAVQGFEHNGNNYTEYRLNKRDCLILVAQNCPEFTAAIVDRWQELESQQKPKLPQTYAEALLEAGRLALENEKQAEQLRLAAPKVEFVEKYIDSSTGSLGFRKVAKLLKVNEKAFREFLNKEKIMYKLSGDWVPYQNHIDAGRFEVKAGLAEHEESSHAFTQSKFTAKGVEWVAGEYAKSLVRDATKV